jgi:hypothetical protein
MDKFRLKVINQGGGLNELKHLVAFKDFSTKFFFGVTGGTVHFLLELF